ncbi:transcriptional regulator [compost metagenome]
MSRLQFKLNGQVVKHASRSRLATNDGETQLQCGLLGHGIVQLPRILAQPHLERGELTEILPDYCPPPLPIFVVYPERRLVPPQVAAFIGWVASLFEENDALRG